MANEDKAARYHRLRRRSSIASTAAGAIVLLVLLVSGASAALRDLAAALSGGAFYLTSAIFVAAVALLHALVEWPLAFYQGVVLERRYGLTTQSTASWCRDQVKAFAVSLLFAVLGAWLIWTFIRWNDEYWWLPAALACAGMLVVLAQLAPVVLLPLFYEFKPLDRPALRERLLALAARARTPVLGAFEWRLSDRTRKANAALAGMGRTRRILLSDTLLAAHSDDEIEVILAHELAHHVHRDIWTGIAFETALIVIGCYAADRVMGAMALAFGLQGKSDIAALPLLVLTLGAVSLALMPAAHAFSRAQERRADAYALDMTRNPGAFIAAMRRLSAQNLAEDDPSRLVEVLFHSHPPTSARVAAARRWHPREKS